MIKLKAKPNMFTNSLYLCISRPAEFNTFCKDKYGECFDIDDTYGGLCCNYVNDKTNVRDFYIWLPSTELCNTNIYNLMHESIHASVMIMNNHLVPVNVHNDEVLAYFTVDIFRDFIQKMGRLNKGKSIDIKTVVEEVTNDKVLE